MDKDRMKLDCCPFCGSYDLDTEESRLLPTMKGPGALISVYIRHYCSDLKISISARGRDHKEAQTNWNTRKGCEE